MYATQNSDRLEVVTIAPDPIWACSSLQQTCNLQHIGWDPILYWDRGYETAESDAKVTTGHRRTG